MIKVKITELWMSVRCSHCEKAPWEGHVNDEWYLDAQDQYCSEDCARYDTQVRKDLEFAIGKLEQQWKEGRGQ